MNVVHKHQKAAGADTSRDPLHVPAYLWFLTALTVLYLLVEVPFAAYLVNLLGSDAGHEDIERAEQVGRIVSGAALALAVWGWQFPRYRAKRTNIVYAAAVCLVTAAACVSGVYYGEKALIDQIAANAPVANRQQALSTIAVRNELFSSGVTGIDASVSDPSDGTWLAFVGLFPFISMQDRDVLDRTVSGRESVVSAAVERAVPGIDDFRTLAYDKIFDIWYERFIAYRQATFERTRALGPVRDRVERGWESHVSNMKYRGVIGSRRTTQQAINRVVADVQDAGVPVPNNWNPTDQETFQRAAFGELMPKIDGEYNKVIVQIVGEGARVKPGIETFEEFLRESDVQQGLRRDLGLGSYDGMVLQGMTGSGFENLYRAYVAGFSRDLRAAYLSDPSELGRGKKFDEVAQAAVRSVWVPVLALSLSLLGAAGHLLKLTNYLAVIVLSKRRSRFGLSALLRRSFILRMTGIVSLASLVVMTTYVPANAIVASPYYVAASQGVVNRFGPQVEQGLEWTISWQKTLVPAGTAARSLGVFLPLENYLVGGHSDTVRETAVPVTLADAPLPRPRPVQTVEVAAADTVSVPFPRPRPATR